MSGLLAFVVGCHPEVYNQGLTRDFGGQYHSKPNCRLQYMCTCRTGYGIGIVMRNETLILMN